MELSGIAPRPDLLAAAIALDILCGDPVYRWHPIRLIGRLLTWTEARLRSLGADGRFGGCTLFVILATAGITTTVGILIALYELHVSLGILGHLFVLYSGLALGDLLKHGSQVDSAAECGDLAASRTAVARLVGRDVDTMDSFACRRAAIESLGENLVDGFTAPILWYALAGIPGIVVFKIVSTMDSMVGYRNDRYLQFGWCGARLDDLMNWIPARLAWPLIGMAAAILPGCSSWKALRIGGTQHGVVPGPNPGWSEATMAGAIQRRLIGPIRLGGRLVTDIWLGDPEDAPAGTGSDYRRAVRLIYVTAAIWSLAAVLAITGIWAG